MDRKAWPPLRIAVLAAGVVGTLFFISALVQWWLIPNTKRDGFELMGVIMAVCFFVVLVLPTLVLGLLGRWLVVGGVLGAAVVVLASDTIWHWLPWW